MLGEDDILVCIPTITHPFDLILGSEESQCPTLLPDFLFVMIWLLVIKMWLITWSYYVSTFLPIDLDRHSLHLFNSRFITESQPSPTCWILDWAIWIEQFGSVVPKLYTIHQIPLFWGRGCQILLQSFLLFAQYSWWWYSMKATLSNINLSPESGQMLHSFPRYPLPS